MPSFATDPSLEKLLKMMHEAGSSGAMALIEGQLVSQAEQGYGHLALCPAMLIVKSVRKAKIPPLGAKQSELCIEGE